MKFRVYFDYEEVRTSKVVEADNPDKAGSIVRKTYEGAKVKKIKRLKGHTHGGTDQED